MAIRDKLRSTFGRTKKSSGDSTPSSISTEGHYTGRTDIEYYKPHEIPKSKYKGRVDPVHQEKLDSYSFGDAFQTIKKRTSMAFSGTFSPGGTQSRSLAPSAAPSAMQSRRTSCVSRTHSDVSTAGGSEFSGGAGHKAYQKEGDRISENSDDDTNVANTGLSRTVTAKDTPQKSHNIPTIHLDRQATVKEDLFSNTSSPFRNDTPFTPEELERAMTKVTIRAGDTQGMRRVSVFA